MWDAFCHHVQLDPSDFSAMWLLCLMREGWTSTEISHHIQGMHTDMNADGEHVLWEVGEGHSVKSDRFYCLAEQLGQQKALSTLLAYMGCADNGWTLLVLHHHSVILWFCDILRIFNWFSCHSSSRATSKTLMGPSGKKTCRKSAERDWSKQMLQTEIFFALFSDWRGFWNCVCWATRCKNIWAEGAA